MLSKAQDKLDDKLEDYESRWLKYQKYSNIVLTMLLALLGIWITAIGIIGFRTEFTLREEFYPDFYFVIVWTIGILFLLVAYILVRWSEADQVIRDQKAEKEKVTTQRAKNLFSPASLAEFLDTAISEINISIASKEQLTKVSHQLVQLAFLDADTKEALRNLDKKVEPQFNGPVPKDIPKPDVNEIPVDIKILDLEKQLADLKATSRGEIIQPSD